MALAPIKRRSGRLLMSRGSSTATSPAESRSNPPTPMPSPASTETPTVTRGAALAWAVARRVHLGSRRPANWIQLFKFGLVGGTGYLINIVAFALLVEGAGVHHIVAAVLSFCVAVTNNFVLNRAWTFRDARGGHAGFQAVRFLAVSVGALGVNLL